MFFNSKPHKPRKRSYYPFSKNYPGKRGNSYDIGESRTRRERDERNNIIFYVSLILIFIASFIIFSVAIKLSKRPVSGNAEINAAAFDGAYNAVQISEDALEGGIAYDLFKTELAGSNANAVAIDFKTAQGNLNFPCKNENAVKIGAVDDMPSRSVEIINDLKKHNYKIIARIYCFEDRRAAALISGAGVREKDSGTVWLDNSAQNDGNPWLNPYSPAAVNYILDIIKESIDCGADMILLNSVCFPSGPKISSAVFTADENAKPGNEVLLDFIKRAENACGDIPLAVHMPSDKALNGSKALYGGTIINSAADYNAIDFTSACVTADFEFNGTVYTKDNFSENSLIQAAVPALTDKDSNAYPDKEIIPIIDDEIYVSALENLGIYNYIIIKQAK